MKLLPRALSKELIGAFFFCRVTSDRQQTPLLDVGRCERVFSRSASSSLRDLADLGSAVSFQATDAGASGVGPHALYVFATAFIAGQAIVAFVKFAGSFVVDWGNRGRRVVVILVIGIAFVFIVAVAV